MSLVTPETAFVKRLAKRLSTLIWSSLSYTVQLQFHIVMLAIIKKY